MNKIYRNVWNEVTATWVAVAEVAKGHGKRSGTVGRVDCTASLTLPPLKVLVASLALIGLNLPALTWAQIAANQLPTGGIVVAGTATVTATINPGAAVLNVNQTTNRAAIDWNSFNVGSAAQVNFNQPSSSSVTLNRVLDSNLSQIFGRITAPGQVFLVNPNGVFFAPGASVDVGGLVATTHRIGVDDFMAGSTTFERNGATGSVINAGELKAALGGYIALLAPEVRNEGIIIAQAGAVALASGEAITLNFVDNGTLAGITATQSQIAALVENKNAVFAPGGLIILSAQAMHRLQGGVINNSGRLEATGLVSDGGRILLDASDSITHTGSINVDAAPGKVGAGGTAILLASLSNPDSRTLVNGSIRARGGDLGGDGGFIETSATNVRIMDDAQITTAAINGRTGTWLIDPFDFTVAATGGNITGAALGTLLASNSIQIETANPEPTGTATNLVGTTGTNGDIHVNDAVSWSANTTLTLKAFRNININQAITASHATGKVALHYGQGAVASGNTASYNFGLTSSGFAGRINLMAGNNFSTKLGSGGAVTTWTVITALGSAGDESVVGATNSLQGLGYSTRVAGNFVLGSNITNGADTSTWNTNTGFMPMAFSGKFDGLGHTITGLTINRPGSGGQGLFGFSPGATINNVGLINGSISGKNDVGSIVGRLGNGTTGGSISNSFSTATVTGAGDGVGGLVGYLRNNSNISDSYATGNVSNTISSSYTGGLVGNVEGVDQVQNITNSYATGNVEGAIYVGGLIGRAQNTAVTNSYATGRVDDNGLGNGAYMGGLIGSLWGTRVDMSIRNSYATGNVISDAGTAPNYIGGFIGEIYNYDVLNSYATGNVTGTGNSIGGFAGSVNITQVSNSYALGNVSTTRTNSIIAGGFAGSTVGSSTTIDNSYSKGSVTAINDTNSGGLIGGFIGDRDTTTPAANITDSFWDTQTSARTNGVEGSNIAGVTGKTTAQMKTLATFAGATWDFVGETANGTSDIWKLSTSANNGYPCLVGVGSCPATVNAYLRLITGSSIYGDTPTLTYGLYDASANGTLISNATPTGTVAWSGTVPSNTSMTSTYSLTYGSGITLGSTAYSLQVGAAVNWTINTRPLLITAASDSRYYGSPNPTVSAFTAPSGSDGTGSGLVNGNTISSVTNTIASTATAAALAGTTHAITPTAAVFGTGVAANYDITYVNGVLAIAKANAVVTANSDLTRTYTGLSQNVSGFTVSGLVNGETIAVLGGVNTSGGSGTNAGSYVHTASGTDGNYNLSFVAGSLVIVETTSIPPDSPVVIPPAIATPLLPLGTGSPKPLNNINSVSVSSLAGSADGGGGAGLVGNGGIAISLNTAPPGDANGAMQNNVVTASVPKAMTTSGAGFSFDLPAQIRESLKSVATQLTLVDGSPVPGWIRFDPATQRIEAGAVPDGGLPLQVMIRSGAKQVLIVISERAD